MKHLSPIFCRSCGSVHHYPVLVLGKHAPVYWFQITTGPSSARCASRNKSLSLTCKSKRPANTIFPRSQLSSGLERNDVLTGGHSGADAEHDLPHTNQSKIRDRVQCLGLVTLREPSSVNFRSGLEFSSSADGGKTRLHTNVHLNILFFNL